MQCSRTVAVADEGKVQAVEDVVEAVVDVIEAVGDVVERNRRCNEEVGDIVKVAV
jgi:uncharacterized protein YoxC